MYGTHGPPAYGYALTPDILVLSYGILKVLVLCRKDSDNQRLYEETKTENPGRCHSIVNTVKAIVYGKETPKGKPGPPERSLSVGFTTPP